VVAFDAIFEPIYGKRCWNADGAFSSFLSLEFGGKHLWVRDSRVTAHTGSGQVEPQDDFPIYTFHGDWHLWFYGCNWRVFSGEMVIGDSSSQQGIQRAASRLDGKILKRVTINSDGSSVFQFERYHRLVTKPRDAKTEQWFLYETSSFRVLTCYGDGHLDYGQNENCYEDGDMRIIAARQGDSPSTVSTLVLKRVR
jgi:hypothetical protein